MKPSRCIHVWTQSYSAAPGGIQTFSRFLVEALRANFPAAEICVFAKRDGSGPIKVRKGGDVFASTRDECATQKEADIRVLGFGGWPGPMRSLAFCFGALWRAALDRPDFIISTHVNFAPVAGIVKRFVGRVPLCVIGHGIEVWEIPKAGLRQALREADQLVAVSQFTQALMAKALEVDPSRIEVLPNTFDSERFQPGPKPPALLQRYGLRTDQPVILTVARLEATEQYKGYDQVLRALPAVLQRFPDARYVIVGDGPDRKRVEALVRELATASPSIGGQGVGDSVIFAGYVPNEELSAHYNLCDAFVMPSKGEGFGIVFLEALSCGKPVIAGNKDASVEAVLGGKLGTLVDPDSVEEIAEAIVRVLERTALNGNGSKRSTLNAQRSTPKSEGEAGGEGQTSATADPSAGGSEAGESKRSTSNEDREPNELRRHVIEAYGFLRFVERVGQIVGKLLERA